MSAALKTGLLTLPNLAALAADYPEMRTKTAGLTSLQKRIEARARQASVSRVAGSYGTRTGGGCADSCGDNGGCASHQDGLWAPPEVRDPQAVQMFNRYLGVSSRDSAQGAIVAGQVTPGGIATITVSPAIPLVPKCLVVGSSIARYFRILQITVGVAPAIIGGSGVPAEAFSEVDTCNLAHLNRICSDTNLVMVVQNTDAILSLAFDAVIKGTAIR